jgi:HAD superfamily hydrolase (TIGR01490 family)
MTPAARKLAFYDMDGTLVSSNVIDQYAWFARESGERWRLPRLWLSYPAFATEFISRRLFNVVFFRQYRGMERAWLEARSTDLLDAVLEPATFQGVRGLIAKDRAEGYGTVLLTGSLDFAVTPFARRLGIDQVAAGRLQFDDRGRATGRLLAPVMAGEEKASALRRILAEYNVSSADARGYSDSTSDLPMLEAVGQPVAVNPSRSLRKKAIHRGWPILDLR